MSYLRIKANQSRPYDQIVSIKHINWVRVQADPDETQPWANAQNVTIQAGTDTFVINAPPGGTIDQSRLHLILKGAGLHESVEGFTNIQNVVKVELGAESQYEIWPPSEKLWYCTPTFTFSSGATGSVFMSNRELRGLFESNWTEL